MLYFFFNRDSWWVRGLELGAVGAALGFVVLRADVWAGWNVVVQGAFVACLAMFAFLRGCVSKRWYERVPGVHPERGPIGIETHFHRSHPIAIYCLSITAVCLWAGGSPHVLWAIDAALLFVCYVGVCLLSYHYRDHDETPVNYYSSGAAFAPAVQEAQRKSA